MSSSFFIEFRFHGYPKRYLRGLIDDVARKFKVKGAIRDRSVPHMTIFGPFKTAETRTMFLKIEMVCKEYRLVPFILQGFEKHDDRSGKVIAVGVLASPELTNLRMDLARELIKISIEKQPWDTQNNYWFHSTIAMKDIEHKYGRIWDYVNANEKPHINQHMIRLTVLNRKRRIEREYDLVLQRWLNRREALNKHLYNITLERLRELQGFPVKRPLSLLGRFKRMIGFGLE